MPTDKIVTQRRQDCDCNAIVGEDTASTLKNLPAAARFTSSSMRHATTRAAVSTQSQVGTLVAASTVTRSFSQELDATDLEKPIFGKLQTGVSIMKTRLIPTLIAGSLFCGALAAPLTLADSKDEERDTMQKQERSMEVAVNDAWLNGKLETALLFNEHLNSFDIDTDVKNGVAYLQGAVESDIDRDLAKEIAESIKGVTDVNNKLVVDRNKASMAHDTDAASSRKSFKQAVNNATLTARIKSELLLNTNTAGLAINVDSRDGAVVLSGEVASAQEKELAGKIAETASGTRSVENRLNVKSDS